VSSQGAAGSTGAAAGAVPPLYGLVLAGGASRRMRADKAALEYDGRPQLERAFDLVAARCERTFVSVRREQDADGLRARFPQIVDIHEGIGPLAGIASAQALHPQAAWLVIACDLPFLDDAALARLVAARDPAAPAVAYRSAHDELPEPLCAIYEPGIAGAVRAHIAERRTCPRKLLVRLAAPLLDLERADALDNVNTPEEYAGATATFRSRAAGP
jgi:molybdopterin-guanine dinucleotide biosynthesis protein A